MKSCAPVVANLLAADPAVAALVAGRVYLFQAIQNAPLPDIVINDVTGTFSANLETTGEPYGRRLSVICRATTYLQADAIGEVALACMKAIRGNVDGLFISAVLPVSDTPLFDDTTNINHRILDFRVHYS